MGIESHDCELSRSEAKMYLSTGEIDGGDPRSALSPRCREFPKSSPIAAILVGRCNA